MELSMREIIINTNDAGRRLDRFLRKYLCNAALSEIYRFIRKDIKVNGKRRPESYMLCEGDILSFYIDDAALDKLTGNSGTGRKTSSRRQTGAKAKKQFRIIYEDENILVADKPFGLLTHGDSREKKDHLANQVIDYLIARGDHDPRSEKIFTPAPANRLDRNTTGIVIFGKNAASLKALNTMIREDMISKYYMTIVHGYIRKTCTLTGALTKDERNNRVRVDDLNISAGLITDVSGVHSSLGGRNTGGAVVTGVIPISTLDIDGNIRSTLVEILLVTGRSHQIRAHLAAAGHPLFGDSKYASREVRPVNEYLKNKYGVSTQLLHAHKLVINDAPDELGYLRGKEFTSPLPASFTQFTKTVNEI